MLKRCIVCVTPAPPGRPGGAVKKTPHWAAPRESCRKGLFTETSLRDESTCVRFSDQQQCCSESCCNSFTRVSFAPRMLPLRDDARAHPKAGALLLRRGSLLGAWSCLSHDCGRPLCVSAFQRPFGEQEWPCGWISMRPRENQDQRIPLPCESSTSRPILTCTLSCQLLNFPLRE